MTVAHVALFSALVLGAYRDAADAQEVQYASAERGPRFLLESSKKPVPIDIKRTPALIRRIDVDFANSTLDHALAKVAELSQIRLLYSDASIPLTKRVTFRAGNVTVAAVLTELLVDADVDVLFLRNGSAILIRRPFAEAPAVVGVISGRITDAKTTLGIAGVQIAVEGTRIRASTTDSGNYRLLNVRAGTATLTARRLGYAPSSRSVTIADDATVTVDFALEPAPTTLAAVVSTVTGQQERFKVGNAIATIAPDSVMKSAPVTNINDLLNGRAAGLQVYFNGGLTGVSSPIRIRGTNSFTVSNDPIFVIDGVRVESSTGAGGGIQGLRPGRLADLSPYEIESIDVVKGPSAATLYGSDAANGVIVIRTKRGASGPTQWRFWTERGTQSPAEHFAPMWYAYGTNLQTGAQQRCVLSLVASGSCRQDSVVTWNPLEDKATSPLGTGYRQLYGAQTRGGVQNFTYFLSGEATSETGYLRMPDAEQQRLKQQRGVSSLPSDQVRPNFVDLINLRANIGSALGDHAHVQLSNGLLHNKSAIPGLSVFRSGAQGSGSPPTTNGGWKTDRPGDVFALKNTDNTTRYTASVAGDYQPTTWLATRSTVGLDWSSTVFDALQMNGQGPIATIGGQRQDNRFNITVSSVDLSATADHSVSPALTSRTSVGAQYNRRLEYDVFTTGTTLAPGATTLAGAATTTSSESTIETIVAGMFVEQTFALQERLFLTGAVRFDGGSAFGAAFHTAAYPKASLSWLATDGTRAGWPGWTDNLRLRAAIGASGVQPSAVAARQRDCLASAVVNGLNVTGATLCQLGNAHLKPETQQEIEAGLDAEVLRSRLRLEFTLYNRQSRDAISNLTLAPSAGGLTQPVNLGSVRNRGIETLINARAVNLPQATLDVSVSANLNQNRLLKLGAGIPVTPTSQNQPGYPIFSYWAFKHSYSDADANGIITANEVTISPTATWMGTLRPQQSVAGNVTLGLLRETLRLSAMADYRGQFVIANFTDVNNCISGVCEGLSNPKASLDRQAAVQAIVKNANATSGVVYNGRFLRLREVSAVYVLPPTVARWFRTRNAQVSLGGRNVGLFLSKYPGFSVESPLNIPASDSFNAGDASAPMPRYWLLRLMLDY